MGDKVIVLSKRPATIRKTIDIDLTIKNKTPFNKRNAPEFRYYFNSIWKELNKND